jgi:hypothetical protein
LGMDGEDWLIVKGIRYCVFIAVVCINLFSLAITLDGIPPKSKV